MSVSAVVAAGSALALYYVGRKGGVCTGVAEPRETHTNVHFAPTSFLDDLYFLAEGLRYTYGETLARWRTADLLIGLAYLCRRDPEEHPVADIAQQGHPFGRDLAPEDWPAALVELRELERFFRYCSGLRERRPVPQRQYFRRVLDVTDEDLLAQELRAGVLKPSYVLIRDRKLHCIVLAIRGTHSFKDMFTSLTGASKPHHLVDANGVVLGYSHFGMLAAARWIKGQTRGLMEQALAENPGYQLRIIGHSLGAGTAALLTMMLREAGGPFAGVTCVAVACPSCMTLELAQSCADYVTTVVHNADVIPTISPGSADALREEVMRSSWFREFRRDVRASGIVRAVECGIRGVGSATLTATSWTTSKLAACYSRRPFAARQRRPQHKRRNSSELGGAAAGGAGVGDAAEAAAAAASSLAADEVLPLSSSAPAGSSLNLLGAAAAGNGGPQQAQQQAQQQQQGEWGASWGQRVTSSTSQVLRSTSGLLRRMLWSGSASASAASFGGRSGSEAAFLGAGGSAFNLSEAAAAAGGAPNPGRLAAAGAAAAAAAAADEPPSPMTIELGRQLQEGGLYGAGGAEEEEDEEMQEELEFEEELEEAAAAAAAGGSSSGAAFARLCFERRRQQVEAAAAEMELGMEGTGSLEEEVSLRMHEVQQAVHDAEEEEAASGRDDSTVPAVIRPGSYGVPGAASSARASPSKQDPRWKRQMYPAGRILHLVPARLVPGTPAFERAAAAAAAAAAAVAAADRGSSGDASPTGAGAAAPAAGAGADGDQAAAAAGGTAPLPRHAKHAAQLSVSDLMAGEGLFSRRLSTAAGGGAVDSAEASEQQREEGQEEELGERQHGGGSSSAAAAACIGDGAGAGSGAQPHGQGQAGQAGRGYGQGQPHEEMLLLEGVPQEAYARIKLCRTVLSDHIIPSYLKALESAMVGIRLQAGASGQGQDAAAHSIGQEPGLPGQGEGRSRHVSPLPVPAAPPAAPHTSAVTMRTAAARAAARSGKQD